jgi:hypothetical protein
MRETRTGQQVAQLDCCMMMMMMMMYYLQHPLLLNNGLGLLTLLGFYGYMTPSLADVTMEIKSCTKCSEITLK